MNDMNRHIEQEHPDYTARAPMWRRYRDIYAGGEKFRLHAAEYLVRRHKEPVEVYEERLGRVFYENYIGSIIDWYAATLMREEPVIDLTEGSPRSRGLSSAQFVQNCDQRGTTLTQFFRQQLTETLVCGKSYIVVDFPRAGTGAQPLSMAEEDQSGRSRAYLVAYNAEEVINWSYDDRGEMEWIVFRTSWLKQDDVKSHGWKRETRWIYYDREHYEIYERDKGNRTHRARQATAFRRESRPRAGLRTPGKRRLVADQQGRLAAARTLQQSPMRLDGRSPWASLQCP